MKKLMLICFLIMLSFVLFSQDAGKYTDVKAMLNKQLKVYEDYLKACENVKEAKDVVAIQNSIKESYRNLIPDIKAIVAKHGKLEDLLGANVPEELKAEMEKLKELTMKMISTSMKLAPYLKDPEVQKVQQELNEVMKQVKEAANPNPPEKKEEPDK